MTTKKKAPAKVVKIKKQKPYSFHVPHRPVPKGRPRLGRRGRVFTPVTTLVAENQIKELYFGPKYEGPVSIIVSFSVEGTDIRIAQYDTLASKLRGDIDNYLKLLMDGLNDVAWADDKQVHHVEVVKK